LHPEQNERKKFVQMLSEPEENLQQRAISALEKMTGIVQSAESSLKENRRLWIQWAQKNETLKF
jgi:predicted secreted protein